MNRLLYISPTGKANDYSLKHKRLTTYSRAIELRAHLINAQLTIITHIHPKKLRNYLVNHRSIWIRLLRRSIRKHRSSVNKLRYLYAEESGLVDHKDTVTVIRSFRQDGDILVPVFILETQALSEYEFRTEPHSSKDGRISNNEQRSGRTSVDRE